PRDQNSAFRPVNHLLDGLLIAGRYENNVSRRFAHLIWQRKSMASNVDLTDFVPIFRLAHLRRRAARVNNIANHAFFHQAYALAMDTFAIERGIGLERMSNIIDDANIFAE